MNITFEVSINIREITFYPGTEFHSIYCDKPKLLWEVFAQKCGWKRGWKNLGTQGITLFDDQWKEVIKVFPILTTFKQVLDPNIEEAIG